MRWNFAFKDWDLVIGMRYIWSKHLQNWQYQYYVALNPDSPSYQRTKFDWGWQEDLAKIPTSDFLLNDEDRNE